MPSATNRCERSLLRRRALRLGYLNGVLWAVGNGLTSGSLIYYLMMDMGARGPQISLLLATPAMFGLLRLFTPAVIRRCGGAKPTTLRVTLASYVLLLGLPALAMPNSPLRSSHPLAALISLICAHQLLEYVGTVALWTWWADLIPRRIRGRYFSRRQIYQLLALIPTLALSGAFVDAWLERHPPRVDAELALAGYAIPTAVGAIGLLLSLVPLVLMPATIAGPSRPPQPAPGWRALAMPFGDRAFLAVLLFGCWTSFFNGLAQSPQSIYPKQVLHLSLLALACMRIAMQLGQVGVSHVIGPFADRYGNRPVLVACQWSIGLAPLFFLLASPEEPYWVLGAWLAWSAYAGSNVCVPNLVLRMCSGRDPSAYVAAYFATSSLAYGIATVVGGEWFGALAQSDWQAEWGDLRLDAFGFIFLVVWITRTMAVWLIARVREPGAWSWRRIVGRGVSRAEPLSVGRPE